MPPRRATLKVRDGARIHRIGLERQQRRFDETQRLGDSLPVLGGRRLARRPAQAMSAAMPPQILLRQRSPVSSAHSPFADINTQKAVGSVDLAHAHPCKIQGSRRRRARKILFDLQQRLKIGVVTASIGA